jgi:hypothetical protein
MNLSDTKSQSRNTIIGLVAIMLVSILMRTIPALHLWPNFTPIAALALFSGAILKNRKWMFVLPIGAMLISDTIKELTASGTGFYPGMSYVYGAFFAILALGLLIKNPRNVPFIAGASVAGSILFFLITNFGAWMSNNHGSVIQYTKDFNGLMTCFAAGIPFFTNTLLGDLFFNGIFFGGYALLTSQKFAVSSKA